MTAIVFLGPSVRHSAVDDRIDFRPPAGQGDLYRAALQRPDVIGLVDGFFEGVPSVLHKEILWALGQGIHVLGAASMGALRAAELAPFGMIGIGRIFESYRDGTLEDDDEVAVLHGPPETGYVALTEPMVNVRATTAAAVDAGVLAQAQADQVCAAAKALFYKNRTWDEIRACARAQGLDPSADRALDGWLGRGRVDAKAEDADALLDHVQSLLRHPTDLPASSFDFEWTQMWDRIAGDYAANPMDSAQDALAGESAVLDELRLDGAQYQTTRDRALVRLLASREAFRKGEKVDETARRVALGALRSERGLFSQADLVAWAEENGLDEPSFDRLLTEEARVAALRGALEPSLEPYLIDELRLRGTYRALAARAQAKNRLLSGVGQDEPTFQSVGLTPSTLAAWFFGGRQIPDDLDGYAQARGFAGRKALHRALLREYVFQQHDTAGRSDR